jgi:hypothetical protein
MDIAQPTPHDFESLARDGIVKVTNGLDKQCERVVETESWCGALARWGTSQGVKDRCDALDKIMHHTPTDTVFRCHFSAQGGCRAKVVQPSTAENANLIEIVRACPGGGPGSATPARRA